MRMSWILLLAFATCPSAYAEEGNILVRAADGVPGDIEGNPRGLVDHRFIVALRLAYQAHLGEIETVLGE